MAPRSSRLLLAPASLAAALVACGGGARKGGSTTPDAPDAFPDATVGNRPDGSEPAPGGQGDVTAAEVCSRIFELKASHCDLVGGYALSPDECLADYNRSLEERGEAARLATNRAGHCLIDNRSCDAVTECFSSLDDDANNGRPEEYRSCAQTEVYAPVGLSQADWMKRKGGNVRAFSAAATTKDDPVAVCGIPAQMEWLLGARCDDGSNPFASYEHAHAARVGNVGPGGKCGSIIDLYEVPCPEGTYAIYIDAYVCPVPAGQPVP